MHYLDCLENSFLRNGGESPLFFFIARSTFFAFFVCKFKESMQAQHVAHAQYTSMRSAARNHHNSNSNLELDPAESLYHLKYWKYNQEPIGMALIIRECIPSRIVLVGIKA